MKIHHDFRLTASVTINDKEAEVIDMLTSYDLVGWFTTKCNRSAMTPDYINETLSVLRSCCHKILNARKRAIDAIEGKEVS